VKLSKKSAKVISQEINSLMCYSMMVNRRIDEKQDCSNAMQWYNQAADNLIAMGIPVVKYNPEV
jgi:hypothetical protein